MEQLQRLLAPLLARFKALDVTKRVLLITAVALLGGGIYIAYGAATATRYATLFANLEQSDASQVLERLRDQNVPFTIEAGGSEIRVPEAMVHETRLTLAGEGLPNGGGVGYELFDQQRFGESEFSEQVKYHRAMEGELSRTIAHLAGVESARVHLVLPPRSLFNNNENTATASVALKLKPGGQLSRQQTRGIVHLVASSVRGLVPESVTIVDGAGNRLAGGEDESEMANTTLEFQRNYERGQERQVQQILDATLGPGRSFVRVSADVTFSREEIVEERVDPNSVVERSHQITEERDISQVAPVAGGVAGSVSSLTGTETPERSKGILRRSETRNFEISKTTRKAVEPQGRVTRVSVAVVVDGHWKADKNRKRQYTARTPQEIEAIRNVVSAAAGFNKERGDAVSVETVPFADQDYIEAEPVKDPYKAYRPFIPYAIAGAAGFVAIVIFGIVMLGRRKQKKLNIELAKVQPGLTVEDLSPAGQPMTAEQQQAVAALSAAHAAQAAALPAVDEPRALPTMENHKQAQEDAEQLRTLTAEIAAGDPYLAARIVRMWLTEGHKEEQAT